MTQSVPRVKTVLGPVFITNGDGIRWTTAITYTSVDLWRRTSFGRVNFGKVWMSPARLVEVDGR